MIAVVSKKTVRDIKFEEVLIPADVYLDSLIDVWITTQDRENAEAGGHYDLEQVLITETRSVDAHTIKYRALARIAGGHKHPVIGTFDQDTVPVWLLDLISQASALPDAP